jgi:pimeloyl-ACP methyl ester carboxylesterase
MPDRVKGVVLVEALKDVDMKLPEEAMSRTDSVFMDIVTMPTVEKLTPFFFRNNVDASFQRILTMLEGGPRRGWKESLEATMRWSNEDCAAAIQDVKAPIVAINSDQTPTNEEAFRRYAPSFELKRIAGVGHVVMWDASDEFDRLLAESVTTFSQSTD